MSDPVNAARTPGAATVTMFSPIQWSSVFAGAIAAAALAFILHSFAAGIGLAVSSTAPTWRDSSAWLLLLTGVYLILVSVASLGLGGYVAGRVRRIDPAESSTAGHTSDCVHGLLVWGLATLMAAMIAFMAVQTLTRVATPPSPQASAAGENIIAYDLDRLFRSDRVIPAPQLEVVRAEAARILLTVNSHDGLRDDDRTALLRLTSLVTGLAPADVQSRVGDAVVSASDNIRRARRAAVILAFMLGAAGAIGAIVAVSAARAGSQTSRELGNPAAAWRF